MIKMYKLFMIIIFLVLSFPFLFFSFGLIKLEYKEMIKFGNILQGVITDENIEQASSSLDFGYEHVYYLKIINSVKLKNKTYSAQVDIGNSTFKNKTKSEFVSNVKKGDTVSIKILSDNKVQILKWKNLELNTPISYWVKFGRWILIIILLSISFYLYFKIYKIIIK